MKLILNVVAMGNIKQAILTAAVVSALSVTACKTGKEVEYFGVFKEADIESIHPEAWLEKLLTVQKEGLGTHYQESGYPYNTCLWSGVIPKGGNPIAKGWWPYEQTGYLLDGLYRCGIFLRDSSLLRLGEYNIDKVLSSPRENGMLGPDVLGDNQWAFSVFARALTAYYDFREDGRVPVLMKSHFNALPDTLTNRQACIIESMCKIYGMTGDTELLDRARSVWDIFSLGGTADNEYFRHEDMAASKPVDVHGVTAAEVGKQPAILYLYTGDGRYLDAAKGFFESVEAKSELVDGIPTSCEQLHAKAPEALHETCDISDFLWAYGYMLMATGGVKWADKMEKAMFNAALGAVSKDFRSHQYFSSPNQVVATHRSSIAPYGRDGAARQAYRAGFDTECCSGNVHRMFPNYISRMWMKDSSDGIVAALYAPSVYETEIKGKKVRVTEDTDYPFSGRINFRFEVSSPVRFAFKVRIPQWAEEASVTVNGSETVHARNGEFYCVERTFRDGDSVSLELLMTPEVEENGNAGVNVTMGPLLFSVDIKEKAEAIVDGFKSSEQFPAYDIVPDSKWNYAVEPGCEVSVSRAPVSDFPWSPDTAPIRLKIKAYEVPSWKIVSGTTPELPAGDFKVAANATEIELLPSGCTRIRLTTFPIKK